MARGPPSPTASVPLPKVSFVKVQDDGSTKPAGVHDGQARSYGYNDFSDFERPEHYIRHIEPLESELAVQVEYDMDEQDQEWLDVVNVERKKEQLNAVSYETFEIVMDRLEKEWFDLTKNIPKPDLAMPSEDSTCAICDDSEGENSNAIVFCDGCNLAVHQDCYGVPYIPEGQWLCRKCTVSPENPVSCVLCPNEGGAFKQTILGEWVHLLCAIWVPETRVANDVFMEPITGLEKVSKQRWKLKCSICGIREGACIQCSKTSCFLAFHATCARKEKFLMPMKSNQGADIALTCYCEKHLPKEQSDIRMAALAAEGLDGSSNNARLSKSARAYAKTYKPGPPLVPNLIVDRIMQYIAKIIIRKKPEFVWLMCKYWSLKREARRGAPLLKRLHLEPWTASSGNKLQTEEEKAMKLEQLKRLRNDLETVRSLAELAQRRETYKREQVDILQDVIRTSILPHEAPLRTTFEKIMSHDKHEYFKNPVSKAEVPDYFDIVKNPMCWNIIDTKLDRHEYWDIQAFKSDILLVLSNALLYNKPGTPFSKTAQRIQNSCEAIFVELEKQLRALGVWHTLPVEGSDSDAMDTSSDPQFQVGSLEPSLGILELLLSEDAIMEDTEYILKQDPLTSLFNFELGKLKPPPPPPPPKPAKPKRDRKAEQERRKLAQEAKAAKLAELREAREIQAALDVSPGFRAPRTRKGLAAAAAFEAEARAEGEVEGEGNGEEQNDMLDPAEQHSRKEAAKQRNKVWKRGPLILPGRSEIPPIVNEVDNRQSFKMFDAGWILPENQKRGGRTAADRAPLPPPRKRVRTSSSNRETSRLSVLSTSASENQTLRLLTEDNSALDDMDADQSMMDVDIPAEQDGEMSSPLSDVKSDEQDVTARQIEEPPATRNVIRAPDGTIIVETLDTPALRRQKSIARKAARLQRAAEAQATASPSAGPSRLPAVQSTSSSLTDMDGDEEKESGGQSLAWPDSRAGASVPPKDPAAVVLADGQMLEGGTLVWAKASSYPWWPAVVFELDDPGIPMRITEGKKSVRRTGDGLLHLVRFFDKTNSWQWVEVSQLQLMFENKDLDDDLLSAASKKQRWRTKALRDSCRAAFRRAEAERQLDGEPDPEDLTEGGEEEEELSEKYNGEIEVPVAS